jgi:hypothetical protein
MLVAKIALGIASTVAFATIYTFREGLIKVDVDEFRVHVWVPAAAVPAALHFAPHRHMENVAQHLEPFMPTIRQLAKELRKYPDAQFVEVVDGSDHVKVGTSGGKLQIDVVQPGESVHVTVPISTLEDVASQLEKNTPGA